MKNMYNSCQGRSIEEEEISTSKQFKSFRDPIHNLITLNTKLPEEKLVFDLINTKEFQRLRHISQLGVSAMVYPGATHTRFAHSLGTFYLCRRVCEHFQSIKNTMSPKAQETVDAMLDQKKVLYSAAILHDIGHGPFSHALETVTKIDHENITTKIICGNTDVNSILNAAGITDEVSRVIKREHQNTLLVKLISSQMDMDRTDYLLRDSYMTGVQYGRIDLEWLIHSLRVGFWGDEAELGLDVSKGLTIAESFVLARYNMHLHVYLHKVTRGVEVLIQKIFKRVRDARSVSSYDPDIESILYAQNTDVDIASFLRLDEHSLWSAFRQWANSGDVVLKKLCSMLLERNLFTAKEFTDKKFDETMDIQSDIKKNIEKSNVLGEIKGEDTNYFLGYDEAIVSIYKDILVTKTDMEASEQIFLIDHAGKAQNLSERSSIINTLRNSKEKFQRFYYPKEIDDKISN